MNLKSILLLSSAMLVFAQAQSQTHISTNGKKYTLVEEATGNWCGYCPDGAQVIEQTIEPNYPRTIIASWHNGDAMQLTGDPFCSGSGYITGFPLGTVNRTYWGGAIQQNRGQWTGDCAADSSATPKFDVSMVCTYDNTTRVITIAVTGKALSALTGNWRINAFITEDSISSSGSGYTQHSYMYPAGTTCANGSLSWFVGLCASACPSYTCSVCANLPTTSYSHMNVVNSVLASGGNIWGDIAFTNPAVNATFTKNYTYTIPTTSNYQKVKVIGLVQKYGSNNTDRAIENCIEAKVPLMWKNTLGLSQSVTSLSELAVYPNPAGNYINVSCMLATPAATTVTIASVVGQVISEQSFTPNGTNFSENIAIGNLSNGTYFMTLTSNGEKTTKQFVVSK